MCKDLMKLFLLLLACLLVTVSSCFAENLSPKENYPAVGDIVTFGRYEQDNNLKNGPEPIEWIVLDVQDGKALLLSRYGLDEQPYNKKEISITWEDCTLRAWLNEDFVNAAFTHEEWYAILVTDVDNSSSQGYSVWSTNGGYNTRDEIFLLSYAEANRYLGVARDDYSHMRSRLKPTAYANRKGFPPAVYHPMTAEGDISWWWWLRSPGDDQDNAASVNQNGLLDWNSVFSEGGCVRPAFWLNLESDFFN